MKKARNREGGLISAVVLAPLAVGLVLASGSVGHADTLGDELMGNFTVCASVGCSASVGSITATVTGIVGSTETIAFDVTLGTGIVFAKTGALSDEAFAFGNTASPAPSVVYTFPIASPFVGDPVTNPGTYGGDGLGTNFNYAVECPTCGTGTSPPTNSGPLDFSITGTGLTLASLEKLSNGGTPVYFDADIGCVTATFCSSTGDVGVNSVSIARVPGPIAGAGLPGLVVACGGLLGLARRRRNKFA
jgi:hypothetical protein